MEYLGLLVEILLLAAGVYLYLFSRGLVKMKDTKAEEKAAAFRNQNGTWLRIAALALVAIMFLNLILHISQLINGS